MLPFHAFNMHLCTFDRQAALYYNHLIKRAERTKSIKLLSMEGRALSPLIYHVSALWHVARRE